MGTWIEIRCEKRAGNGKKCCCSDVNTGPMGMADDTFVSVRQLLTELSDVAVRTGWKKTSNGWVCPNCAGTPPPTSGD